MIMKTYAILGATGQTGSELTKYLTGRGDVHLNLYARSRSRVDAMNPTLASSPQATIYIGDISDTKLISGCLKDTKVIFATVATNHNDPECSIARRTAHSIIEALEILRADHPDDFVCPTVVFLSSGALDPVLLLDAPAFSKWLGFQAFGYIYEDLRLAFEDFARHPWIPLIQAEPGMLVTDIARGVKLGGSDLSAMVSYADLARGMVQMAEEDDGKRWVGKGVPVSSTGGKAIKGNPVEIVLKYALPGLLSSWCPPLWRFGRSMGWWGC